MVNAHVVLEKETSQYSIGIMEVACPVVNSKFITHRGPFLEPLSKLLNIILYLSRCMCGSGGATKQLVHRSSMLPKLQARAARLTSTERGQVPRFTPHAATLLYPADVLATLPYHNTVITSYTLTIQRWTEAASRHPEGVKALWLVLREFGLAGVYFFWMLTPSFGLNVNQYPVTIIHNLTELTLKSIDISNLFFNI